MIVLIHLSFHTFKFHNHTEEYAKNKYRHFHVLMLDSTLLAICLYARKRVWRICRNTSKCIFLQFVLESREITSKSDLLKKHACYSFDVKMMLSRKGSHTKPNQSTRWKKEEQKHKVQNGIVYIKIHFRLSLFVSRVGCIF